MTPKAFLPVRFFTGRRHRPALIVITIGFVNKAADGNPGGSHGYFAAYHQALLPAGEKALFSGRFLRVRNMTPAQRREFDRPEGIMPATTHAAADAPTRRIMAVDEAMKAG